MPGLASAGVLLATAGFVPDTVQAEGVVDCSGYGASGSVRFSVRLLSYDRHSKRWHTVRASARRYGALKRTHHLTAATTPCVPGTYRGVFRAVLRDASGRRVSVNVQKLGLHVEANCVVKP